MRLDSNSRYALGLLRGSHSDPVQLLHALPDWLLDVRHAMLGAHALHEWLHAAVGKHGQVREAVVLNLVVEPLYMYIYMRPSAASA